MKHLPKMITVDISDIYRFAAGIVNPFNLNPLESASYQISVVRDTMDKLIMVNSPMLHTPPPYDILELYVRTNTPVQTYVKGQEDLMGIISFTLQPLYELVAQFQETYVTSLSYKIIPGMRALVNIHTTKPTRDYEGILSREIEEAKRAGEFIPYKFLRAAGQL